MKLKAIETIKSPPEGPYSSQSKTLPVVDLSVTASCSTNDGVEFNDDVWVKCGKYSLEGASKEMIGVTWK